MLLIAATKMPPRVNQASYTYPWDQYVTATMIADCLTAFLSSS